MIVLIITRRRDVWIGYLNLRPPANISSRCAATVSLVMRSNFLGVLGFAALASVLAGLAFADLLSFLLPCFGLSAVRRSFRPVAEAVDAAWVP